MQSRHSVVAIGRRIDRFLRRLAAVMPARNLPV